MGLTTEPPEHGSEAVVSYQALGHIKEPQTVTFTTPPFPEETEFTGHIVVHLNVSGSKLPDKTSTGPSDIDLFITLRHLDPDGREIHYTGTVGDPVPITKGWLRVSLRKVNEKSARHTFWHPQREYLSTDASPIVPGEVYPVDVEIWPTNVVVDKGAKLVLEVSSGDTQGAGIFEHTSAEDRAPSKFEGMNHLHFGPGLENWVLMPVIPAQES